MGTAIVILLCAGSPLFAAPNANKLPAHCDRACLIDTMNDYVAALVAHDPSRMPLSPHVEFVENTVPMHPGDGLWKTADGLPTTFKIYVPDPISEEVGLLCVMRANNEPIEANFRVKIRHGEIVAAEHLWAGDLKRGEPEKSRDAAAQLSGNRSAIGARPARRDAENRRHVLHRRHHRRRE